MSYVFLILLLLVLAVFILPIIVLIIFFFVKRNSIVDISEMMNSILYKFASQNSAASSKSDSNMSKDEALKILGLTENANNSDVNQAYHNLMKSIHPDKGGSAYLAQKLNEARDILLNK